MLKLRVMIALTVVLVLLNSMTADDEKKESKIDKTKIVGSWKLKKGESDFPSPPILTFSKDGKISFIFDFDGKELAIKGTYEWKGADAIKVAMEQPSGGEKKEETVTVTKLTDKEVEFVDEKKRKDLFERIEVKKEK